MGDMSHKCRHGNFSAYCEECNEWIICKHCDGEEGHQDSRTGDWIICPYCEGEGMWLKPRSQPLPQSALHKPDSE